jgi:hypothetical protein
MDLAPEDKVNMSLGSWRFTSNALTEFQLTSQKSVGNNILQMEVVLMLDETYLKMQ